MKYFIYLLLVFTPFSICAQLHGTWLEAESRHTRAGVFPKASVFIEFMNDSIRRRHVFYDTTYTSQYLLKGDSIVVNDSTTLAVKHLSKDSLILGSNEWSETIFYPVKSEAVPINLNKEHLLGSVWSMYVDDDLYYEKLIFNDTNYYEAKSDDSKLAVQWLDDHKGTFNDPLKWSLMNHRGQTYLTITPDYTMVITNKVLSVDDDVIQLLPMSKGNKKQVRLVKNKPTSTDKSYFVNKILVSKKWDRVKTTRLVEYEFNKNCYDTILIVKDDFIEKDLSLEFKNDDSYCLSIDNEIYDCGSWQLLSDGYTIRMGHGWSDLNYFTIEKIRSDRLVISFCSWFSYQISGVKCAVGCYKIYLE